MRGGLSAAIVLLRLNAGHVFCAGRGASKLWNCWQSRLVFLSHIFKFVWKVNGALIIGMCFVCVISAFEPIGDTSGITKGGAGRDAIGQEIARATNAERLGILVSELCAGLPNTSFTRMSA
ncbi:solute carrier family 23 protein [Aliiroseovarius crassostreae]|uniref:solute carrier family 23 protein n=1 Tax=Aliiroseovarius crassostreae TaxID=154981 RepID=UPI003C7D4159